MKFSQFQLVAIAGVTTCAGPVYADGLGGLGALRAMFLMVAAIVVFGVFVLALNLAQAYRSEAGEHGKSNRLALMASIIYLLAASPFCIRFLIYPRLDFLVYLIVVVYLAVLATTFHQVFTNKRHMVIFFGAAFLFILLRTPEIISYTEYHLVDNVPLLETIELSEQKDNQYIHLADGKIFRFTERYNSSGQEEKFDADAKLMIEGPLTSKESGVYTLHGLRISQEYHNLKIEHGNPLITIPIKSVTLDKNEVYQVGLIELLDANWKADNRTLTRAIMRNCCDSAWVEELIKRGANPTEIMIGSRNILHYLGQKVPKYTDVDSVAVSFIKSGVDLNAKDQWGNTPLYVAIDNVENSKYNQPLLADRYKSYITVLLEYGADSNTATNSNDTPLNNMIIWGNYELAHLLLAHGADPRQKTFRRETVYEMVHKQVKNADTDNQRKDLEKLLAEMNNQ